METFSSLSPKSHSSSDCINLGRRSSPSFPYYGDWKFGFEANLKPKICITASTSAGLDQILPWMFYHKVIGVTTFFLFVEGHAASPNVSKVLESIPHKFYVVALQGVKVIYRTRELEEQQAKRYHEHVWGEKDLRLKLLRKGILTRIDAPMAMIQGLRESGVFSSVIANAPTTLSRDKFLASIDSSNSSRAVPSMSFASRKIGRNREHQTSARKVLEIEASAAHEAAVPPLSPPVWTMTPS